LKVFIGGFRSRGICGHQVRSNGAMRPKWAWPMGQHSKPCAPSFAPSWNLMPYFGLSDAFWNLWTVLFDFTLFVFCSSCNYCQKHWK
jgi:hypothetical protein